MQPWMESWHDSLKATTPPPPALLAKRLCNPDAR